MKAQIFPMTLFSGCLLQRKSVKHQLSWLFDMRCNVVWFWYAHDCSSLLLIQTYIFKHQRPSKPSRLRIYESHVGIASPEPKVSTYSYFTQVMLPMIKDLGKCCYVTFAILWVMSCFFRFPMLWVYFSLYVVYNLQAIIAYNWWPLWNMYIMQVSATKWPTSLLPPGKALLLESWDTLIG